MSALLRPMAMQAQHLDLARRQVVDRLRWPPLSAPGSWASRAATRSSSARMPNGAGAVQACPAAAHRPLAIAGVRRAPAAWRHSRAAYGRAGAGADARVHRQRRLEVALRLGPARHGGAEQSEIAVRRTAADQAAPRISVAARIRQQQLVQLGCPGGITERGADLAEIDHAESHRPSRGNGGEIVRRHLLEFRRARRRRCPTSRWSSASPGRQVERGWSLPAETRTPPAAIRASRPCSRRRVKIRMLN